MADLTSDSRAALIAMESDLDAVAADLTIGTLPLRSPLAVLHGMLNRYAFGDRFSGQPAVPAIAEAAVGRLFGMWAALKHCPVALGGTFSEAVEAYHAVDDGSELGWLLGYGHFCELMPEVHNGLWSVSGSRKDGFVLHHASEDLERYEMYDWLLLLLGSPILLGPRYLDPGVALDNAAQRRSPWEACDRLRLEGKSARDAWVRLMDEPPLLTAEGFRVATGATRNQFRRTQGALVALADLQLSLANAQYVRYLKLTESQSGAQDAVAWEAMEYASVAWPWQAFVDWVGDVAQVPEEVTRDIVEFFCFDPNLDDHRLIGDGYWPPLTRIGDKVLVAPVLLRAILLERNVLYAINRVDQRRFDTLISSHLEPQLLADAAALLDQLPDLEIVREIEFPGGEIDVLVYDPATNTALHIQAKAALPPQGARMTRNVEGRAKEALAQLAAFANLDGDARDTVLGRALGRPVSGVVTYEVLLTRSCFGRAPLWTSAITDDVVLLNPGLLGILISRRLRAGLTLQLSALGAESRALLGEIATSVQARWTSKWVSIGDDRIEVPMLDSDQDAINSWRIRASAGRLGNHELAAQPVVAQR